MTFISTSTVISSTHRQKAASPTPLAPSASQSTSPMLIPPSSGSHQAVSTTTPHLLQNITKAIPTMSRLPIPKPIISGFTNIRSPSSISHCLHLLTLHTPNSASITRAISPMAENPTGLSVLPRIAKIPGMYIGLVLAPHLMAVAPMFSFDLLATVSHLPSHITRTKAATADPIHQFTDHHPTFPLRHTPTPTQHPWISIPNLKVTQLRLWLLMEFPPQWSLIPCTQAWSMGSPLPNTRPSPATTLTDGFDEALMGRPTLKEESDAILAIVYLLDTAFWKSMYEFVSLGCMVCLEVV